MKADRDARGFGERWGGERERTEKGRGYVVGLSRRLMFLYEKSGEKKGHFTFYFYVGFIPC